MIIVTLQDIKDHCRLDGTIEDAILELYGESAEATVLNLLNRTIEDIYIEFGRVPAPIKHAVLLLVSHSYRQREPASMQNLYTAPYTLDALLKPYMIL